MRLLRVLSVCFLGDSASIGLGADRIVSQFLIQINDTATHLAVGPVKILYWAAWRTFHLRAEREDLLSACVTPPIPASASL